jgi:chemotaxis protein methyltransferase CheR
LAVIDTTLSAENFAHVARLVRDQCGLVLEPGKEYLVQSRLAPLVKKHQAPSVDRLIDRLRGVGVNGLVAEVVEALVTTETSFFRDIHPFESLKKSVLPELIQRRAQARQLNIWCAASSSGQEPYSLALLLREYFPELRTWQINFLATDISRDMLARSQEGRYSQLEVNRGLPTPLLLRWFQQEGGHWRIDDRLRTAVTFSHLNLIQPWPAMPPWDLVLLRNVLIYFDSDAKRVIFDRLSRALAPHGYLLLGGAETTLNLTDSFTRLEHLKAGFYQRKP